MHDPLRSVELVHLIWAIPLFQLIHEFEEWNILRWYRENYVDLPDSTNLSVRVWIVFFSLIVYVWTTLCFFIPNVTAASIMILLLVMATAQNALQHLYWLFYFRKYAPGALTSVALVAPLDAYIVYRMLDEALLPIWTVIAVAALIIPGLVETVCVGNRMTTAVRVIVHEFPIKLIRCLSR
jgi:hypothetical protein